MQVSLVFLTGWIVAVLVAFWACVRHHRQGNSLSAAEAVAFAEKYYWGASEETLEREAMRYFEAFWPWVPMGRARRSVRETCRRRKLRAKGFLKCPFVVPAEPEKSGRTSA